MFPGPVGKRECPQKKVPFECHERGLNPILRNSENRQCLFCRQYKAATPPIPLPGVQLPGGAGLWASCALVWTRMSPAKNTSCCSSTGDQEKEKLLFGVFYDTHPSLTFVFHKSQMWRCGDDLQRWKRSTCMIDPDEQNVPPGKIGGGLNMQGLTLMKEEVASMLLAPSPPPAFGEHDQQHNTTR